METDGGYDATVPWMWLRPTTTTLVSRSLLDFARIIQLFDDHRVSFVSVTQQFNTATSMGRLVLNVLLSFAQFGREIISSRRGTRSRPRRRGN